jgi:hypothetical protein
MLAWWSKPFWHKGRLSRRTLLRAGFLGLGGLALPRLLVAQAQNTARRKAKSCILIFLNGGPSQLDTFDMKPDAPSGIRGPYKPIATRAPGVFITEKLPRLAQQMHRVAIVRSAHHHLSAHNSSAAYALSGHSPGSDANIAPTATDHPALGAIVARMSRPGPLPPFVLMPTYLFDMGFPTPSAGGGWLGRTFDPFPVVRNQMMAGLPPWEGELPIPKGIGFPPDVSRQRLQNREGLARSLDQEPIRDTRTFDAHHRKALELILSADARSAFDLGREPDRVRDRYGRCEMGQVLLLARRQIEAGVRFVTANAVSHPPNTGLSAYQIWDTHFDHFRLYDSHLMPKLDQALSALLADLADRGLLEETLVLVMGEFGRTPKIANVKDGGRDHWGRAYSVLFAGGGVRSGTVFGRTDAVAGDVTDFPVRPDDLAATVFEALGIPADTVRPDLRKRPHRITEGGPIRALFG